MTSRIYFSNKSISRINITNHISIITTILLFLIFICINGPARFTSHAFESSDAEVFINKESTELSGNCGAEGDGSNVKWSFETGTLTISGSGKMIDKNEIDNQMISTDILNPSLVKKVIINDGVTTIGDYAFFVYDKMTELTMADSVTSIGSFSLAGNSNLSDVRLSDNLTTIKNNAFFGCSSIEDLTLPDSLSFIGESAFSGCTSIREITIPKNVSFIDYWAFSSCTELKKVNIQSLTTGSCTFTGCTSLTTVNFNPKLERIEGQCFTGCTDLKTITFPDSLTFIGCLAFDDCSKLNNIYIPDSVTQIDNGAFHMCSNISEIHIPESLTTISPGLFSGCSGLTDITIPSSVTKIENGAFQYCNLSTITIPDSVESIEDNAFSDCGLLTSVKLPSGLKTLGKSAFGNCNNISDIKLPDSIVSIGENAFNRCEMIDTVVLPKSLTTIGRTAFSSGRIILPESLTNISNYAFGDDENIKAGKSIVYCATDAQIDYCKEFSYSYIDAREPVDINELTITIKSTSYVYTGNAITPECTVTYNDDDQAIPLKENFDYTLEYNNNVDIGTATVIITGIGPFTNSTAVNFAIIKSSSTISNPDSDSINTDPDNKTGNTNTVVNNNPGSNTDNSNPPNNSQQQDTSLSDTDNQTGNLSQNSRTSSKEIQSDKYLVGNAYYRITGSKTATYLRPKKNSCTKVSVPATVKINKKKYKVNKIASDACAGYKKLQTVTIGKNVVVIGNRAFMKCPKLKNITFGKNVNKLGNKVLYNDKNLKNIKFKGSKLNKIGDHTFKGVPHSVNILVPNKMVSKYARLINKASK